MEAMFGLLITGGFIFWIGWLFYKDALIKNHGVELNAKIINIR
ncbi:hypothetical protein QM201_18880 [Enterobacter asburiae]|nr:hypothetical protein [Enterobacter asburiae]